MPSSCLLLDRSAVIFAQHVEKGRQEKTVSLLVGFRNYLHYHLKATKTYMHMRMRKRVAGLLQGELVPYRGIGVLVDGLLAIAPTMLCRRRSRCQLCRANCPCEPVGGAGPCRSIVTVDHEVLRCVGNSFDCALCPVPAQHGAIV